MSDPDNFLSRWSRRKREVSLETEPANPPAAHEAAEDDRAPGEVSPCGAPAPLEPAFDPASLPPIESITAETDISGFLAAGVPSELTRAALRRAWASDPRIRNFVGLADYDWDFNAAGSMAGFGPLDIAGDVSKLTGGMVEPDRIGARASDLLDPASTPPEPQQMAGKTGLEEDRAAAFEADHQAASLHSDDLMGDSHKDIAVQDKAEKLDRTSSLIKRRHGGALPK
jgi:hypothetical protein